jgi:hypothetical protein
VVSSTNNADCHDVTEILLKVELSTVPKDILINWLFNLLILNVPDEDYSRN